jgi:hypothetical protein
MSIFESVIINLQRLFSLLTMHSRAFTDTAEFFAFLTSGLHGKSAAIDLLEE